MFELVPDGRTKTANAISYFAHVYLERKGAFPTQLWIYKLLALLDFRVLKSMGAPCLGLIYDAHANGPVPRDIYDNRDIPNPRTNNLYVFKRGTTETSLPCYFVEPKDEPELQYFSDFELDTIEQLCDDFLSPERNLKYLIEATHREIRSWQVAWDIAQKNNRKSLQMEYEDEFPGLSEKSEDTLTLAEDAFLMYCGIRSLEEALCES